MTDFSKQFVSYKPRHFFTIDWEITISPSNQQHIESNHTLKKQNKTKNSLSLLFCHCDIAKMMNCEKEKLHSPDSVCGLPKSLLPF